MKENYLEIELTRLEWHLLHSLVAGASNKQIADAQGKSEHTVRNQLVILFRKISVKNRAQAVNWYHEYLDVTETAFIGTSVLLIDEKAGKRMGEE